MVWGLCSKMTAQPRILPFDVLQKIIDNTKTLNTSEMIEQR